MNKTRAKSYRELKSHKPGIRLEAEESNPSIWRFMS